MIDYLGTYLDGRFWESSVEVLFVGDRTEDEQSAAAAGVAFQWADEWRAQYATTARA